MYTQHTQKSTKKSHTPYTQEDKCTPPRVPPNGVIVSCSYDFEDTCTIKCKEGYSVGGGRNASGENSVIEAGVHIVLLCDASLKSWRGVPPLCQECSNNYYKKQDTCLPCTTSECPRGMYRAACGASDDAFCVPCTSPLPANAYYATGGSPYYQDNCLIVCDPGFVLSDGAGSACVPAVPTTPAVTVGLPGTLQVSETYKQSKRVTLPLYLTIAPTSTVTVKISVSRQLTLMDETGPRPSTPTLTRSITFTTTNFALVQNVYVDAWDDGVYEAEHGGLIFFSVESGDPAYNKMQVGWLLVNILCSRTQT